MNLSAPDEFSAGAQAPQQGRVSQQRAVFPGLDKSRKAKGDDSISMQSGNDSTLTALATKLLETGSKAGSSPTLDCNVSASAKRKGLGGRMKGARLRRMVNHDEAVSTRPTILLRGDETISSTSNIDSAHSTRTSQVSSNDSQHDAPISVNQSVAERSTVGYSPKQKLSGNLNPKFNASVKSFLSNISPKQISARRHQPMASISSDAPLSIPFGEDGDDGDDGEDDDNDDGGIFDDIDADGDDNVSLDPLELTHADSAAISKRRERHHKKRQKHPHESTEKLHSSHPRLPLRNQQYRRVTKERSVSHSPKPKTNTGLASRSPENIRDQELQPEIEIPALSGHSFLMSVLDDIRTQKTASGELQMMTADDSDGSDVEAPIALVAHTPKQKKTVKEARPKDKKRKHRRVLEKDKKRTTPSSDTHALSPNGDGIPLLSKYSSDDRELKGSYVRIIEGDRATDNQTILGSANTKANKEYNQAYIREWVGLVTSPADTLHPKDKHAQKCGNFNVKLKNEDDIVIPLIQKHRLALEQEVQRRLQNFIVMKRSSHKQPQAEADFSFSNYPLKEETPNSEFRLTKLLVGKNGEPPVSMDDSVVPDMKGEIERSSDLVRRKSCPGLAEENGKANYGNINLNLKKCLDGEDFWMKLLSDLASLPKEGKKEPLIQAPPKQTKGASDDGNSRRGRSRDSRRMASTTNGKLDHRDNITRSKSDSQSHLHDSTTKGGLGVYTLKQQSYSKIDPSPREKSTSHSNRNMSAGIISEATPKKQSKSNRRKRMSISKKKGELERERSRERIRERSRGLTKEGSESTNTRQLAVRNRSKSTSMRKLASRPLVKRSDVVMDISRSKGHLVNQHHPRSSVEHKDRERSKSTSKSLRGQGSKSRYATLHSGNRQGSESQSTHQHSHKREKSKRQLTGRYAAFNGEDRGMSKSLNNHGRVSRRTQSLETKRKKNSESFENEDVKFRTAMASSEHRLLQMERSQSKLESMRCLKHQGDNQKSGAKGNHREPTVKNINSTDRLHKSESVLDYDRRRSESKSKRGGQGGRKLDGNSKRDNHSDRKKDKDRRRSNGLKSAHASDSNLVLVGMSRPKKRDNSQKRSRSIERARRSQEVVKNVQEEVQKIRQLLKAQSDTGLVDATLTQTRTRSPGKIKHRTEEGRGAKEAFNDMTALLKDDGHKQRKDRGPSSHKAHRGSHYDIKSKKEMRNSSSIKLPGKKDDEGKDRGSKSSRSSNTKDANKVEGKLSGSHRKYRESSKLRGRKRQSDRHPRSTQAAVVMSSHNSGRSSNSDRNEHHAVGMYPASTGLMIQKAPLESILKKLEPNEEPETTRDAKPSFTNAQ